MEHEYKKPDLHAPRNREDSIKLITYTRQDPDGFFAEIKEKHPYLAKCKNEVIAGWFKEYIKILAQEVIDNRDGVKLPGGLGTVSIGLCKPTEKTASNNINFGATNHYGEKLRYTNMHTDGLLAKIYYDNDGEFRKDEVYFKPCTNLKDAVSTAMHIEGQYKKYRFYGEGKKRVSKKGRKGKRSKPSWRELKKQREEKQYQEDLKNYDPLQWD